MASVARLEPRPQSASPLHSPTVWVDAWWRCSDQTALLVPAKTQEPQIRQGGIHECRSSPNPPLDPSVAGDVANGPIVAAVDGSPASRAAIDTAIRLGRELGSPLTFVYVRRGPASIWGSPIYQRRLTQRVGHVHGAPSTGR